MDPKSINENFLWPNATDLPSAAYSESELYKFDPLLSGVEDLVSQRKAWPPITGTTRRTEKTKKLEKWIGKQENHKNEVDASLGTSNLASLEIDDFPSDSDSPKKRTVTIARNIAYLIDECGPFLSCIENAFGAHAKASAESVLDTDIGVFLYVTNSVTSNGRAFKGDPFTGQGAAYSRIFTVDLLNNKVRNFVCYYPHQLYSQFYYKSGAIPRAKGVLMLRSQAELLMTAGGVMINPEPWKII
jgi:hypothetical protein